MREQIHEIANAQSLPKIAPNWAIFFDIDGPFVKIDSLPGEAIIPHMMRSRIKKLSEYLNGAVAIISRHNLKTIDQLFAPYVLPAAGQYGLESRGYNIPVDNLNKHLSALQQIAPHIYDFQQRHPELMIEDKGLSIAIHYKRCPFLNQMVINYLKLLLIPYGQLLRLQKGKMMVEILLPLTNKGNIIRGFMNTAPFEGRVPVFIGAGISDKEGFTTVNNLNGVSIKVGICSSDAHYCCQDTQTLWQWISNVADHIK